MVLCASEDHATPEPAVAHLVWPDGRHTPAACCHSHLVALLEDSLDQGHPVLVHPVVDHPKPTRAVPEPHSTPAGRCTCDNLPGTPCPACRLDADALHGALTDDLTSHGGKHAH